MTSKYDFHCHSTASDGSLPPQQLVQRAASHGVTTLALTDHDTTAGLALAHQAALECKLRLINGIELSVTWHKHCLHLIGLGINPESPALIAGVAKIQALRRERVQKIAERLEKKHILGAYPAMLKIAGETGMITRSHFADFLVAEGHVLSEQQAFDYYLGQGKPAYVAITWADLTEAIDWIRQAGGVAVLAHPLRYRLTASTMNCLLAEFKHLGGVGLEVVGGRYHLDDIQRCAAYAQKFALAASLGSDFHNPKNPWLELGRLAELPSQLKPIWDYF